MIWKVFFFSFLQATRIQVPSSHYHRYDMDNILAVSGGRISWQQQSCFTNWVLMVGGKWCKDYCDLMQVLEKGWNKRVALDLLESSLTLQRLTLSWHCMIEFIYKPHFWPRGNAMGFTKLSQWKDNTSYLRCHTKWTPIGLGGIVISYMIYKSVIPFYPMHAFVLFSQSVCPSPDHCSWHIFLFWR